MKFSFKLFDNWSLTRNRIQLKFSDHRFVWFWTVIIFKQKSWKSRFLFWRVYLLFILLSNEILRPNCKIEYNSIVDHPRIMTPPSFLKLLLQSVLLISTRANLFTQISDIAINSVYQSNSTEFYLNLEPFLKVHVKWLNDKSTVVKGSHGNGHDGSVNFAYLMERIDKTENKKSRNKARKNASSSILGYKLSGATQGNFRAHWLSSVGFIPKKLQDTSFENKARFIITLQGFFVQFAGKLGNQKYLQCVYFIVGRPTFG